MTSLLETIKGYVTPELLSQVAGATNESESSIGKAISGIAPTLLAGILNKSGDAGAMGNIFGLLPDSRNASYLDNLGGLIGQGNLSHDDPRDASGNLLGMLFGNKVPAIMSALSSFAGLRSESTSSLLGMVGPLIMGVLGRKISSDGLNVSGLMNLLQGERSGIMNALPSGLGSIMGLGSNLGNVNNPVRDIETGTAATGNRWLMPLLLLLALGAAIMYFLRNCNEKPAAPAKTEISAPAPAPTPAPEKPALSLTAGTEEAALLAYVKDAATPLSKDKWFNFPEIMFDVNKATLKAESEAKLNAVLSILKAYPSLRLKVGGYTDSDGNDVANKKPSDERAKATMNWLTGKGIEAARLEAEGYGEEHPVAPNDAPDNKAKNRRISFRVLAR